MRKGFTLIELLVVIAIIAILATLVISRIGNASKEAKDTKMKSDVKTIIRAMNMAKTKTGLMLNSITGSNCSGCNVCRQDRDLRNILDTDPCMVAINKAFKDIEAASGIGITSMSRDPWGSPYLIDENELEDAPPNECERDSIYSVGPSGISHNASNNPDGMFVRVDNVSSTCINRQQ